MRVLMLRSENGSPDGSVTNRYKKNIAYDLPPELAQVFIESGVAKAIEPPRNKARGAAPQNKSAPAVAPADTFRVGVRDNRDSGKRAVLTIGGPNQGPVGAGRGPVQGHSD
jgi:hypothetical protein